MADQGATLPGFEVLEYHPGNSEFPSLPADPFEVLAGVQEFGDASGFSFQVARVEPLALGASDGADGANFGDWYMDTIWVTPAFANFGDITADKDIVVTFHNTFRVNQSLDSSDTSGVDGISQPTPGLPINVDAFASQEVTVRADEAGPDSFDDFITFTFSISGVVSYRVLGQRVLFFATIPQSKITEQLQFKTDIIRSKDGTEKAASLRLTPRMTAKYSIKFSDDRERTEASNILFGGGPSLNIGIQLWWQAIELTTLVSVSATVIPFDTTTGSWGIGQTVSFVLPDRTTVEAEIETLSPSQIVVTQPIGVELPAGTFVMPIRFGYMARNANMQIAAVNLETMSVEFTTNDEIDLASLDLTEFDQYAEDDYPIIKKRWILGSKVSASIGREQNILDGETGIVAVRGSEALGEYGTAVSFPLEGHAQIFAYLQFAHYLRGSWRAFYMPTFQNDLPLNAQLALGGTVLLVKWTGLKTFIDGAAPKRDLRIVTDDGTVYYRRITSVVDNGTHETINVSGTIGSSGFSQPEGTTVSFMHLSRVSGDAITFDHLYSGRADMKMNVRSIKE